MTKYLLLAIDLFVSRQFVKFIITGGILYLFSVSFLWFTIEYLQISPVLSLFFLQIVIFFVSFFLSKKVIFRKPSVLEGELDNPDNNSRNETLEQGKLYLLMFVFFRFLDWAINSVFIEHVGIPYYTSLIFTILMILPLKFYLYKNKVFR